MPRRPTVVRAAELFFAASGKITFPSKYLDIAGWDQLDEAQDVLSFILIGSAESMRNVGGLVQYTFEDIFSSMVMPSGPLSRTIAFSSGFYSQKPFSGYELRVTLFYSLFSPNEARYCGF